MPGQEASQAFALAKMITRPYYRLPYAGPVMLVQAYLHSELALPPEQPHSDGLHFF